MNAGLVDFVQSRSPHTQATLDMDACLVESHKKEALYSYKKYRAYQPLTTYWAEADLVVHSEFPRRQRACGPSAASSVEGGSGTSACWGGQGHAEV